MVSAINDMVSNLQSYNNAVTNLNQTNTNYKLKTEPISKDDITVAQSQLDNAKANLVTAQETYDSRIITAPFSGQIGGLSAEVGQTVSSSEVLGTIITPQKVVNITKSKK